MKRFYPSFPLPIPTVEQVLWRSGCPPDSAGPEVSAAAVKALDALSSIGTAWCGAVLPDPTESPVWLTSAFHGRPATVMAATLGNDVMAFLELTAGLQSYMNDSAASVAVESYMKKLQLQLAELLGMQPTKRAAPGYGDMPLSLQRDIVDMFPDSGILCSAEYVLSPVKSMTGVVGWIQPEN